MTRLAQYSERLPVLANKECSHVYILLADSLTLLVRVFLIGM